jgi:hypothetical protein
VIAVTTALLLARRRRLRTLDWVRRSSSAVDEIDSLALHIGAADAAALGALGGRDGPRLAALNAQLRELQGGAPHAANQQELSRLIATSGELQTLLMSTQLPGTGPSSADVHRSAAQVTSAAASARAGLRLLESET